jgi:hypothetical protein
MQLVAMGAAKMAANVRVLRTGAPLTMAAIQQHTPAVFAVAAQPARGPRYRYVPTSQPLQALLDAGWGVWETRQQRSRSQDRDPYTKHMLRLRKLQHFTTTGEGAPEIVLVNAHDGTAAYSMHAGYFRFICSNGLMVGQMIAAHRIVHTVSSKTTDEILASSEELLTNKFPQMFEHIDKMRSVSLSPEKRYRLAQHALQLRYGSTLPTFPAVDLLIARRAEDQGDSAWTVLNRVQENVMNGGWDVRTLLRARSSAVRPVERVSVVNKINAGLWDKTMELVSE